MTLLYPRDLPRARRACRTAAATRTSTGAAMRSVVIGVVPCHILVLLFLVHAAESAAVLLARGLTGRAIGATAAPRPKRLF